MSLSDQISGLQSLALLALSAPTKRPLQRRGKAVWLVFTSAENESGSPGLLGAIETSTTFNTPYDPLSTASTQPT